MGKLDGRVIIVTGGGVGIGRAYCERLAVEGAKVVIADIDVTSPEDTEQLARTAVERFGRIDGLINNAAMFQRSAVFRGPFEEIPVDEWDRLMAVNLRGVFLCSRAVVPHMKQQRGGKFVNISSSTVQMGTPFFAHYLTSKAGVIGFTRVLARELGDDNICVNAVAPGQTLSLDDVPDERLRRYGSGAQSRSLKRIQHPDDLVGAVVYLCSSDSDFVTGRTLVVDGGVAMH